MQGKRRLSPSKATWCAGDKVDTAYETSCARYVVWERRFEKEAQIDPLYKTLGDLDELRFATKMTQKGIPFVREQEFTYPIGDTSITIEGRYDFKLDMPSGPVLVEKKSVTSLNRKREIIDKSNIDPKQLAQLVTYMAIHKIPEGRLVATFWQWSDDLDALMVGGEREFTVQIAPNGAIMVDGQTYTKHVRDVQKWFRIVAKGMEEADRQLPERPLPKAGWQNPCKSCPLAQSCDKYDMARDVNQFWVETKDIEPRAGKPADISVNKLKKGKKNEQSSIPSSIDTHVDTGRIQDKASRNGWEVDS
jgi:hypothetical protein